MNRKYYLPFIIVVAVILAFISGRGCEPEPQNPNRIDTLKIIQTKYKDTVRIKEVIRNKVLVKWREVRHDSLIPCETKLLVCDTVIRIDSSLICSLKDVIRVDSIMIVGLNKQVKRERNKKRLWMVVSGIIAVAEAVR